MNSKQNVSMRSMLLVSGAIILVMAVISAYVWMQIPAGTAVCTHWDAAGECNGYGGKFAGIFLLPLTAVGMAGLFTLIPRIEPRAAHFAESLGAYAVVWIAMLLFFLALHIIIMLEVLGRGAGMSTAMPILMGVLFVLIGGSLGRVRSNYFFGIRTPWTLSSELSWEKTHRLGGKLFIILGVCFVVAAWVLKGEAWIYGLMGGLLALVLALTVYSYVIWRSDPDAHPLR